MRYHARYQAVVPVVVLLAAAAGACGRGREARVPETAAAPAAVAAPASESAAAGTLARRTEAQDHFDRSRAAFVRKDVATAATELRAAAAFLRRQADSATAGTRTAVAASATELDRLAGEAERGAVGSARSLDAAFARANRAEAERHRARAVAAWARQDTVRAGEELTMAVDHLERAAKDAGATLDAAARAALAQARTLGAELIQGRVAVPADVEKATAALGRQIDRIGKRIARREA